MKSSLIAHRLAQFTCVATFCLLLVGGLVNPTGSSLACPDWPLCYGQVFPRMSGGIAYEHTHRLVASFVGLLTCILAISLWQIQQHDSSLRRLGLIAVGMVVVQGLLGGITVMLRLPMVVSVTHLGLSMVFFSFLVYIVLRTRAPLRGPIESVAGKLGAARLNLRRRALIAAAAVYCQILLGALVRHSASGMSCGTDPVLCLGSLWIAQGPAQLHMLHRFFGLTVVILIGFAALPLLTRHRRDSGSLLKRLAWALISLAGLQIVLGMWTVISGIGLIPVTAHLGTGAALLAMTVTLFLELGPQRLELKESNHELTHCSPCQSV